MHIKIEVPDLLNVICKEEEEEMTNLKPRRKRIYWESVGVGGAWQLFLEWNVVSCFHLLWDQE